jgi:equilibrative nucleoside transporter 1/2/3
METDTFNYAYGTFVFHGVISMLPWNIMITPSEYFSESNLLTWMSIQIQAIMFISCVIAFLCKLIHTERKMAYSLFVVMTSVIAVTIIASIKIGELAFIISNLSVAGIIFLASSIHLPAFYYTAAKFPMKYTNALVIGGNLGGLTISFLFIWSRIIMPDKAHAIILYFCMCTLVLLFGFLFYLSWPNNPYYEEVNSVKQKFKKSFLSLVTQRPILTLTLFISIHNTHLIYPLVQTEIKRVGDFVVDDEWFVELTCYLTFNMFVLIGNICANYLKLKSSLVLLVLALFRYGLTVPFFLMYRYKPVFTNDYAYWAASAINALIGGYTTSLTMMNYPIGKQEKRSASAGMASAIICTFAALSAVTMKMIFNNVFLN